MRHMTTLPVPALLLCTLNLQPGKENWGQPHGGQRGCVPLPGPAGTPAGVAAKLGEDSSPAPTPAPTPPTLGAFLLSIRGKMRWRSRAPAPSQPYMKTLFFRLCPWKSQCSTTSHSASNLDQDPAAGITAAPSRWLPAPAPHLSTTPRRCHTPGKAPRSTVP